METKEQIKNELRNMSNPFSDRGRYLRKKLKLREDIE
jgi:hypothetical protein